MIDPKRLIKLQKHYQSSKEPLWLRGKNSKLILYPFYVMFTISTVYPLYHAGKAIYKNFSH